MPTNLSKAKSFSIIIIAYSLAFIVSVLMLIYLPIEHPILRMAAADVMATIVIFVFSLIYSNSSIYDPYWSVYPIFIGIWWLYELGGDGNLLRNLLVLSSIMFWGVRLTYNWARGWPGMVHEDWRYTSLAQKTGKANWLVSFLGIHLIPTVLVFFGCIPLFYIYPATTGLHIIEILGCLIMVGATIIEWVADNQMRAFKLTEQQTGVMQSGLWKYSRHPNYFGEIMFWLGLAVVLLPYVNQENMWAVSGVILMIILFVFISIPMMEKRQMTKPGFKEYRQRTSSLIPLPKKKSLS